MNIYKIISENVKAKLMEIDGLADALPTDVAIETPKIRDFGDFSTNVAMILARPLKKAPRDIAEMILPKICEIPFIENATIAGPGFINITLKNDFLVAPEKYNIASEKATPLTVDMDYGSYNIGKALHIGHLRTSIVGDTFNRIAKLLGHKTYSWNHIGDWA